MRATIEDLKDTLKIGYDAFKKSRAEADEVWNLYHNRQFTDEQLAILRSRGQPPETFNIVKMFSRMLVGYYSTVVNTAVINAVNPRDVDTAALLNDIVDYTFKKNRFKDVEGDKIKLSAMISGLLISYVDVFDTGDRDEYNRPINRISMHYIPDSEVILDPLSRSDDYSDARFIHRFKWLPEESVKALFGSEKLKKLTEYYNYLDTPEADFEYTYGERFVGKFKVHDNYLIVHSVLEDDRGQSWSCYWCDDVMLKKERITYKNVRWPYRVERIHTSDRCEYYGIFREVIQSQHAINQAVIKIQLMVNSEKAFVEEGAVENLADFEIAFNRVNGIIPVNQLAGIRIESLTKEVQDQYFVIDKALDRVQRVLGINDSFLGMAFASDSGRKVKLQQNATIMSLRYITARIESFYELLASDIANLAKQYYYANQIFSIVDEVVGQRWIELNKPIEEWSGQVDPITGQPIMQPVLLPQTDPATQDFMEDEEGNILLGPVSQAGTDFSFTDYEVEVQSAPYNDEDEKAQLLLESFMSGAIGQMMMRTNPAGFFKMGALSMKSMKTKYSPNIVEVLDETANMLSGNPQMNQSLAMANQGQGMTQQQPLSRSLKLPTNTQGEF